MARDIMLGQYYQTESLIHRLDPRVKLFGTTILLISVFMIDSVVSLALVAAFLLATVLLTRVPVKRILKGLKGILFLLCISMLFTLLFTRGEAVFEWGIITVTKEGIRQAIRVFFCLSFVVMGSSILTLTTTPNDLTDGMEKAFGPLKKIKVPVHDIAMMISIAFRFIPILMEETDKIIVAQKARGAEFDEGGLLTKAKAMIPVIVPLIVSSINRALELATAMESRCYRGGEGRTKMKPLKYKRRDYVAYGVCLVFLACNIAVKMLV